MANASISGLVSGLDTATLIDQFMSIEAQPQTDLKTRLTSQQSTLSVLQGLNAKVSALTTQAKDLTSLTAWQPLKATSSNAGVSVTATSGSSAGSFDLTVLSTARAQRTSFSTTALAGDHVTGTGNDVTLTVGGKSQTISSDGTMSGLVAALNAGGTGVRASTVKLDDGTLRLVVQSAVTGAANGFTLTNADGSALLDGSSTIAATDAAITLGQDTLHSPDNTFENLVPGVSVTVSAAAVSTGATTSSTGTPAPPVTIDVTPDASAVQTKVKALVDAVNTVLGSIDSLTDAGSGAGTAGPLAGDTTIASLRTALLGTVYPPGNGSLASIGLQTDRNGKLVLDTAKLATAYAQDPGAVTAALGTGGGAAGTAGAVTGFAQRLKDAADRASNTYTGTLSTAVAGRTSSITRLKSDISTWDDRLALRRASLTQQFTALETALSQMKSQSSWLAGQISSLPTG